eukprot:6093384-Pleurochrysis_carterae.AAC.1
MLSARPPTLPRHNSRSPDCVLYEQTRQKERVAHEQGLVRQVDASGMRLKIAATKEQVSASAPTHASPEGRRAGGRADGCITSSGLTRMPAPPLSIDAFARVARYRRLR